MKKKESIYCYVWLKGSDKSIALNIDQWLELDEVLIHRLDGPAVVWVDGTKQWWVDGKPHRLDGPAVEWSSGVKEWAINGLMLANHITIEKWLKENSVDLTTAEGQMALKLMWM